MDHCLGQEEERNGHQKPGMGVHVVEEGDGDGPADGDAPDRGQHQERQPGSHRDAGHPARQEFRRGRPPGGGARADRGDHRGGARSPPAPRGVPWSAVCVSLHPVTHDVAHVTARPRRPATQKVAPLTEKPLLPRLLKKVQMQGGRAARCEAYSGCTAQRHARAQTPQMGLFQQPATAPRPSGLARRSRRPGNRSRCGCRHRCCHRA